MDKKEYEEIEHIQNLGEEKWRIDIYIEVKER